MDPYFKSSIENRTCASEQEQNRFLKIAMFATSASMLVVDKVSTSRNVQLLKSKEEFIGMY